METLPCHIQIAKTGTNTARSLIADSVARERLLAFKILDRELNGVGVTIHADDDRVRRFVMELRSRQWETDLVTTTLPFGIHSLIERRVEYFTFVREPVARCLSAINFVYNRRGRHPVAAQYAALGWSAAGIVASGDLDYCNDQVRVLSGSARRQLDEGDLESARKNIVERFHMVGTTEMFPACWHRIAARFGLHEDPHRRENSSDYSAGLRIAAADVDAIRRANLLDIRLYDWVCREYLPQHHGLEQAAGASAVFQA